MYEHLGTWNRNVGRTAYRLDLWDTGRTDHYGKSLLRYALAIMPEGEWGAVIFDGDDFACSSLQDVDSDATAGAVLSFFSAYGESIRYSGAGADVPAFTPRQREALEAEGETLGMWSYELEVGIEGD